MTPIRTAFLTAICLVFALLASCGETTSPDSTTTTSADGTAGPAGPSNAAFNAGSGTGSQQPAFEPTPPAKAMPNILVFLIDTQRADYLTMYGHEANTSPNLQAFADDALVFEKAFAAASSTSPSHASIFTSTYPQVHGVWNRVVLEGKEGEAVEGTEGSEGDEGEEGERTIYPSLALNSVTLAEVLQDGGYNTAGICDGGNLQLNRGMAQGFDYWDSKFLGAYNRVAEAKKWFTSGRDKDMPFFMFLHTYQVHTPYLPAPKFVEMFVDPNYDGPFLQAWKNAYAAYTSTARAPGAIRKIQQDHYNPLLPKDHGVSPPEEDVTFIKALYQAEIRLTDDAFGQMVAWLKENDLYEDTLIIVTSDHGEEFWEHGTYGHHQVYDTTLHVPLIVRAPGGPRGERRSEPVELIDLMPTLIHHADLPPPPTMQGRIIDLHRAHPDAGERDVIGESNWPEHQIAVRVGEQKAVLFPEEDKPAEVFDLATAPGEVVNIAGQPDGRSFLSGVQLRLDGWIAACVKWRNDHRMNPGLRDQDRMSDSELAELEGLGYFDEVRGKAKMNKKVKPGVLVGPKRGQKAAPKEQDSEKEQSPN
jgi:arylsulfatase A-like enzyme